MLKRLRNRPIPRPLMLLLGLAAIQAVAWSTVVPAMQGADEPHHFAYTQRLVERGELPQSANPGTSAFSQEVDVASRWAGLSPLIANPAARPAWTGLEERSYREIEQALPDSARAGGTGPNSARNNPPLYYAWGALSYSAGYEGTLFTRLQLMRLGNVPLYLAIIALTWALTAELLPRPRWARTLAAAAVALHPQLAHFAGMYAPDVMLAAIWAAFFYVGVLLLRRGPQAPLLAALAGLTAASLLTHPRGIPIVVPALAAAGLTLVLHRPVERSTLMKLAAFGTVAALPVAAYLLSIPDGNVIEGSAATASTVRAFQIREFLAYVWQYYLPPLSFMDFHTTFGADLAFIHNFYGAFAWQEVTFSPTLYEWLRWLTHAGLLGLVVASFVNRRALRGHWPVLVVLGAAVLSLFGAIHYSEYREILNQGQDPRPQIVGRYLFPLLPLFGLAIAFTVTSLPRRGAAAVGAVIVAFGSLLQLTGLGLTFVRFYA